MALNVQTGCNGTTCSNSDTDIDDVWSIIGYVASTNVMSNGTCSERLYSRDMWWKNIPFPCEFKLTIPEYINIFQDWMDSYIDWILFKQPTYTHLGGGVDLDLMCSKSHCTLPTNFWYQQIVDHKLSNA